jgi:two-component system response regulator MprA
LQRGDRPIELTRTEFALLELFLRLYVGYLRRKTEAGGEPRLLHTVRGVGYVLAGCYPALRAARLLPTDALRGV